MTDRLTACDDRPLVAMLTEEFEDDRQIEHLENCSHCQSRLQALAADDEHWQKVARVLNDPATRDDPADVAAPGATDLSWTSAMVRPLLDAPVHPEMLGRLGRYDVERLIGTGGMGLVLKAFDTELNRPVAIKLLSPYLAGSEAARQRFAREARSAAGVVDDHVVPIYNVESDASLPYLVMQYVAGGSLQERVDANGTLELAEVVRVGMQTARALAAAHAQGLVHRDVKPSNILLDEGVERAMLTDFGLARTTDDARLTRSGFHPGTPDYMSPEQVRGEAIDARSDLFSLGCVLYTLSTGRLPFRAETTYAVLRRITDETPPPVHEVCTDIPRWFSNIVARLMSRDPANRIESASEVAELLETCLAHLRQPEEVPLPTSLMPDTAGSSSRIRSHRITTLLASVLAGLCVLGVVFVQNTRPPKIEGLWEGKGWGTVTLQQLKPGVYSGTWVDPKRSDQGQLSLKWSRFERRFNGTWKSGADARGRVSVALEDGALLGGVTARATNSAEQTRPRLTAVRWVRTVLRDGPAPPGKRYLDGRRILDMVNVPMQGAAGDTPSVPPESDPKGWDLQGDLGAFLSDKSDFLQSTPPEQDGPAIQPDQLPNVALTIPIERKLHPRDVMDANVGQTVSVNAHGVRIFNQADGSWQEAVVVFADECRLRSFTPGTVSGKPTWQAVFSIPQSQPGNPFAPKITAQAVARLLVNGAHFRLDKYKGQSKGVDHGNDDPADEPKPAKMKPRR